MVKFPPSFRRLLLQAAILKKTLLSKPLERFPLVSVLKVAMTNSYNNKPNNNIS